MSAQQYFSIVPCCPAQGTQVTYFNVPPLPIPINTGVYYYDNATPITINGITFTVHQCYTITYEGDSFTNYPDAPPTSDFTRISTCLDVECAPCAVVEQCYTLYPCDSDLPVLVSNSSSLALYVEEFTELNGYPGCYFVVANELGDCVNAQDIQVGKGQCSCTLNCYNITGNPISVTYINAAFEVITTSGNTNICSYIEPRVIGGTEGVVLNFGLCVDGLCPEVCFEFTNCQTLETLIVSNTTTILGYYANNNVVTLQGYEGCWSIDIAEEPCDCAVNVTVLQVFADCPACLPIIAYKFTNCNNQSIIKYSTDDYSAYVGQTVKLDCGDCWFVTLIDFTPPAVQPIVIITSFESCLACSRTYYQLDDCSGPDVIYTYTDLNTFVGNVVKLENCATCWEVSELLIPTIQESSEATPVTVVIDYADCPACNAELACRCSVAWPNETGTLSYIDCTGASVTLTGLDPNTQSEKVCVREWVTAREPIYFGDCVNGECPVEPLPKRFIRPGYFVPQCTTEKYEKFACNSADILYKTVLERRYGISNCCPDTSLGEKWLVKKELADLQGATDPNYTCTPVQTCCNNTPTCGCGCNSRSNTCNS
jgi:hypothetical protein